MVFGCAYITLYPASTSHLVSEPLRGRKGCADAALRSCACFYLQFRPQSRIPSAVLSLKMQLVQGITESAQFSLSCRTSRCDGPASRMALASGKSYYPHGISSLGCIQDLFANSCLCLKGRPSLPTRTLAARLYPATS